jgi:hypothetical protein
MEYNTDQSRSPVARAEKGQPGGSEHYHVYVPMSHHCETPAAGKSPVKRTGPRFFSSATVMDVTIGK